MDIDFLIAGLQNARNRILKKAFAVLTRRLERLLELMKVRI